MLLFLQLGKPSLSSQTARAPTVPTFTERLEHHPAALSHTGNTPANSSSDNRRRYDGNDMLICFFVAHNLFSSLFLSINESSMLGLNLQCLACAFIAFCVPLRSQPVPS